MILIDTSALIDSLCGPRRSGQTLRSFIEGGERIEVPTLVVYEWLRGPGLPEEVDAQEALFPINRAIAFGAPEAALAARLYRSLARPRGREIDLAIAACALEHGARLWTLNRGDFQDIPDLELL